MEQWLTIMAFAILLAVVGMEVWRNCAGEGRRLRRKTLRGRTANSADRTMSTDGGVQRRRARRLPRSLRSLTGEQRRWYVRQWRQLQRRTVAQPATALLDADELLSRLLGDLGYPAGRFVQVAAQLSAAHAGVVDDYRAAGDVALDTRLGLAGTTEIREAMRQFTVVFERLAAVDVHGEVEETAA